MYKYNIIYRAMYDAKEKIDENFDNNISVKFGQSLTKYDNFKCINIYRSLLLEFMYSVLIKCVISISSGDKNGLKQMHDKTCPF